jgi:hypothetical protein
MTLEQLRAELMQGTLCGPDVPAISADALGGRVAQQLREIAAQTRQGPRLQLPQQQMPVLP